MLQVAVVQEMLDVCVCEGSMVFDEFFFVLPIWAVRAGLGWLLRREGKKEMMTQGFSDIWTLGGAVSKGERERERV